MGQTGGIRMSANDTPVVAGLAQNDYWPFRAVCSGEESRFGECGAPQNNVTYLSSSIVGIKCFYNPLSNNPYARVRLRDSSGENISGGISR